MLVLYQIPWVHKMISKEKSIRCRVLINVILDRMFRHSYFIYYTYSVRTPDDISAFFLYQINVENVKPLDLHKIQESIFFSFLD
jgi:hypothetical protein